MKNILLIISDQLTWRALPVYGGQWAKTPNIDRISRHSAYFDSCYTACPLCQPARAAFWTSRYPHEINVRSNGRRCPVERVGADVPTVGKTFRDAGYKTVHFGKTHDSGGLRGFEIAHQEQTKTEPESPGLPLNGDTFLDVATGRKTAEFLDSYRGEKPFFVVADLVNPHNICGWIGEFAGDRENPWLNDNLPPLPENFKVDDMKTRPMAVQYICCSHNRQAQTALWDEKKYRQYLAAYYHYIHRMDCEVGRILDALERSGEADNTLIVFMADHGESMAARGRVTKQVDFYEEAARVPMIFHGPGVRERSRGISGLASLLDLYPTLCGMAGIPVPEGLRGIDLSEVIRGEKEAVDRPYVASEWHTEWGYTVTPGRMIRTDKYKYMEYLENHECELYDMSADPLEMHNLAVSAEYQEPLAQMKKLLQEHIRRTDDDFETLEVHMEPEYRNHICGYENHRGPAVPQRCEAEEKVRLQTNFHAFTRYLSRGGSHEEDNLRSEVMGLGGRGILLEPGAVVQVQDKTLIGYGLCVGAYSVLKGNLKIDDDVTVGAHCVLAAEVPMFDAAEDKIRLCASREAAIRVGRGSCIMSGSTVMAGVSLGRNCLVYPNSVVSGDVPDYAVVSGNPAAVIGRLDPDTGKISLKR